MDEIKFAFVELLKGMGLAVGGILFAKAISGLGRQHHGNRRRWLWLKGTLYAVLIGAVAAGSSMVGHDAAAEIYWLASQRYFERQQFQQARLNAERAVQMRPDILRYWQTLERSKLAVREFESVLADEPRIRSLSAGELSETDAMQFAFAHFFLEQYAQTIAMSRQIIHQNRFYAPPYALAGMAYTAEKKYGEAEQSYLAALQLFPSYEDAVRGLARAYFLSGDRGRALEVLKATAKYPFSDKARRSFAELEKLYSQPPSASPDLAAPASDQAQPPAGGVKP